MRTCRPTRCKGNGEVQPLSYFRRLLYINVHWCHFFFFLNNVKADCVSFILDVKVCYRVLLGYNLKLLRSRCSLCWRKLISWVCQAAMRALQATGSCYHSQVRHADKLTMTAEPSQGVCAYACVHYAHMWVCALVCFPGPEDRNLSMAAEIVGIPGIPPDSKQPVTRQEGERGLWERERGLSAKVIHSGTGTGAIFHKIKAPLFRETRRFTAMIHGEYLEAAGTCSCGICKKILEMIMDKSESSKAVRKKKKPHWWSHLVTLPKP